MLTSAKSDTKPLSSYPADSGADDNNFHSGHSSDSILLNRPYRSKRNVLIRCS